MNIISSVADYPRNYTPDEIIRMGFVLAGDALELFLASKQEELTDLEGTIDNLEQELNAVENMRDWERERYEDIKDALDTLEKNVYIREEKLHQLVNIGSWK